MLLSCFPSTWKCYSFILLLTSLLFFFLEQVSNGNSENYSLFALSNYITELSNSQINIAYFTAPRSWTEPPFSKKDHGLNQTWLNHLSISKSKLNTRVKRIKEQEHDDKRSWQIFKEKGEAKVATKFSSAAKVSLTTLYTVDIFTRWPSQLTCPPKFRITTFTSSPIPSSFRTYDNENKLTSLATNFHNYSSSFK